MANPVYCVHIHLIHLYALQTLWVMCFNTHLYYALPNPGNTLFFFPTPHLTSTLWSVCCGDVIIIIYSENFLVSLFH